MLPPRQKHGGNARLLRARSLASFCHNVLVEPSATMTLRPSLPHGSLVTQCAAKLSHIKLESEVPNVSISSCELSQDRAVSYIFNLTRKPPLRLLRQLPIIHLPPPPPNPTPQPPSLKLRAPIPIPPPKQRQIPPNPLHQRHHHLIPDRDIGDSRPRIGILDAGKVGLLETEVGEWWEGGPAWTGGDVVDDV